MLFLARGEILNRIIDAVASEKLLPLAGQSQCHLKLASCLCLLYEMEDDLADEMEEED